MSNNEVKTLDDTVEIDYRWNPGSVVGRFLTDLRDNGEVTAVRCTRTSRVFLPPQSWSPYGQIKMDRFVSITTTPELEAGTIVHRLPWNAPEGVSAPYMMASIRFAGADTGLVHIIVAPLAELESLKPGDKLQLVWKEEKSGTIRDIDYFKPA